VAISIIVDFQGPKQSFHKPLTMDNIFIGLTYPKNCDF